MKVKRVKRWECVPCCSHMKEEMEYGKIKIYESDSVYNKPCYVGAYVENRGMVIMKYCPFCGERIHIEGGGDA